MKKIDIFTHLFPRAFFDRMVEVAGAGVDMGKRARSVPMLVDLDMRLRMMEQFGDDYTQVLSVGSPPIETFATPEQGRELMRLANDGMADAVRRHPDRFPTFAAHVSLLDVDAALVEAERAFDELGARCLQLYTNVNGRPLDDPRFRPVLELMARRGLPIILHPARAAEHSDYLAEDRSQYEIWWALGWPYETSAAMARLVFSRVMDELPGLRIVTHHCGGLVPYLEGRVGAGWDQLGSRTSGQDYVALRRSLKKRPLDYFREDFYGDTALFGAAPATECGLAFFGEDHVLFASDSPYDPEGGPMYIRETIRIIDGLSVSEAARAKIYHGNAERLLGLPA